MKVSHDRNYIFRGIAVLFTLLTTASLLLVSRLNVQARGSRKEHAQGLWKIFGHTGAVAFSRTGDPATGDFGDATVLRKFGDVPDDLSAL